MGMIDTLREKRRKAQERMNESLGNNKQLADIEKDKKTETERKQDKLNADVGNSGVTNVKVEEQVIPSVETPKLPQATKENVANAKVGDEFVRSNGKPVTVNQGDIDWAKEAQIAIAEATKDPEISQTTGPAIAEGDTDAISQTIDSLENYVTTEGKDGTRAPITEDQFKSQWSINSAGGKSEMQGNLQIDQMSNVTQQALEQNPYKEAPLSKKEWLSQNPDYQEENDFAKKLTYFTAFASIFSGGKIPFVDFRKLTDADQAYKLYVDTINKSNEFQSNILSNETSNLQNTRYGIANTVIGAEATGNQALKQIDAQVEADLRRINAEGMNMLDQISAQGTVQEKLARLQSVLQTQQFGDLMDDIKARGYTDTDIAHFIMAKNLGISPGQQVYENVMKGVNAAGNVISGFMDALNPLK